MKILLVDSGFPVHYSHDVYTTFSKDFNCSIRQVAPYSLTTALINNFHPDILLVLHGTYTPIPMICYAKAKGTTTVLWIVEDPYEIDSHRGEMVNSYDYVFTNEKLAVSQYLRPNVYYLPWCCNPQVHRSMPVPHQYQSDLCFVGMGFRNRVRIINTIAPWIHNLNVKLIGDWQSWGEELHPSLKKFVIPAINNFNEVPKYYNGAKINLNIHRDPVDPPSGNSLGVSAISPNDRTFTLAGCGAFQLVDRNRPGIWECFNDGEEIVGFNNPEDLAQKIQLYLSNPNLRNSLGKAAQKRAYLQHTFKHRLVDIFRIIGKPIHQTIGMIYFKQGQMKRHTYNGSQNNTFISSRNR